MQKNSWASVACAVETGNGNNSLTVNPPSKPAQLLPAVR